MAREVARRYQSAGGWPTTWIVGCAANRSRPAGGPGRADLSVVPPQSPCRRARGRAPGCLHGGARRRALAVAVGRDRPLCRLQLNDSRASFERARQAVDQFYTRFYEQGLLNVPGLEKQRHEVLSEMLQYYKDFLIQHHDDPELRNELAETCFGIGTLTYGQGNKSDALGAA